MTKAHAKGKIVIETETAVFDGTGIRLIPHKQTIDFDCDIADLPKMIRKAAEEGVDVAPR